MAEGGVNSRKQLRKAMQPKAKEENWWVARERGDGVA